MEGNEPDADTGITPLPAANFELQFGAVRKHVKRGISHQLLQGQSTQRNLMSGFGGRRKQRLTTQGCALGFLLYAPTFP